MLQNIATLVQAWKETKETLREVDQQQLVKMLREYGRYWNTMQKWLHGGMD